MEEGGAPWRNPTIMALQTTDIDQLEQLLLRRGVGALEADREPCGECGRTPLIGEQVHVYGGRRPRLLCELCRMARHDPPVASEIVRHGERGHTVRLTARAA